MAENIASYLGIKRPLGATSGRCHNIQTTESTKLTEIKGTYGLSLWSSVLSAVLFFIVYAKNLLKKHDVASFEFTGVIRLGGFL